MRIAHLSDPHINLKYHPQHLPRLRRALEDAIGRHGADHIVITGDLTSNADARDLRTTRRLFESLGIMASSKLTIVPGNHDLYGGPHLADELLGFPERCKTTDLPTKLAIFQDTFAELFSESITQSENGYPFLKRVRNVCFLGLNSNMEYSLIDNPVGSNGRIPSEDQEMIYALAEHHAWNSASQRIVLLHHHLFRPKDISHLQLADGITSNSVAALLEKRTLKLHGKRQLIKLFKEIGVDLAMHGHVHFTGEYDRKGIGCINSAGVVFPVEKGTGYYYHMIEVVGAERNVKLMRVPSKKQHATVSSFPGNLGITVAA